MVSPSLPTNDDDDNNNNALQQQCQQQVQELHALFQTWFQGKQSKKRLETEINERLSPDFSHVAPNGQCIHSRHVLMAHLLDKYASYRDRVFQIDIFNVKLLWTDGIKCLCTYEEWQSWQQKNQHDHDQNNNDDTIQFGRLSTCLLTKVQDSDKMQWIHVHETWLEAEAPPSREQTTMTTSFTEAAADAAAVTDINDDSEGDDGNNKAEEKKRDKFVIFLISSSTLSQQQLIHQKAAKKLMERNDIAYETVDGGDIDQRDFRNQLFDIAGLRDVYPLFFTRKEDGSIAYWGGSAEFVASSDAGTLKDDLEFGVAPPMDKEHEPVVKTASAVPIVAVVTAGAGAVSKVLQVQESAQAPATVSAPKPAATARPAPPVKHVPGEAAVVSKSFVNKVGGSVSAREASGKRHVSPLLQEYAKPLIFENALVGVSVAGFDIGTSQGPIADEAWYKEYGTELEDMAQSHSIPRPRRKICLPEMVFSKAHVAIEGHGVWFSWNSADALEAWAKAHYEIAIHSRISHNGVSVMRAKDAKLWDTKRKHGEGDGDGNVSAVFHYDWTYSTPFTCNHEGGKWKELEKSGMNMSLLTDTSVPILFFDEVIMFEDDLHDNGQVQYSVKLRAMPTCSYVLARLWVRVDNVILRVRETRVLFDFGNGTNPQIFRDVTWRECMWINLEDHKLPTDVKAWHHDGPETPTWSKQLKSLPEVVLPRGMPKHARYEYPAN